MGVYVQVLIGTFIVFSSPLCFARHGLWHIVDFIYGMRRFCVFSQHGVFVEVFALSAFLVICLLFVMPVIIGTLVDFILVGSSTVMYERR